MEPEEGTLDVDSSRAPRTPKLQTRRFSIARRVTGPLERDSRAAKRMPSPPGRSGLTEVRKEGEGCKPHNPMPCPSMYGCPTLYISSVVSVIGHIRKGGGEGGSGCSSSWRGCEGVLHLDAVVKVSHHTAAVKVSHCAAAVKVSQCDNNNIKCILKQQFKSDSVIKK